MTSWTPACGSCSAATPTSRPTDPWTRSQQQCGVGRRPGARSAQDQALTIEEALLAHTIEAAVALGLEDRIGSIEPGKLADLTVLDGDLFTTADDALAELPTWMTVLDGVVVHGAQPQGTLETQ